MKVGKSIGAVTNIALEIIGLVTDIVTTDGWKHVGAGVYHGVLHICIGIATLHAMVHVQLL